MPAFQELGALADECLVLRESYRKLFGLVVGICVGSINSAAVQVDPIAGTWSYDPERNPKPVSLEDVFNKAVSDAKHAAAETNGDGDVSLRHGTLPEKLNDEG